jgi:hypothetical protein
MKDFILYEQAFALKQLGFNFGVFSSLSSTENTILVPTYSQAFRWFREKHNLIGGIQYIGGLKPETTWWDIYVVGHFNTYPKEWEMKYQPYEEAELACLKKLIEIVNGGNI